VNPSPVPAAFCCIRSGSALTLGRRADSSLPRGDVEDPWSRSKAAHDGSWRGAGAAAGTRAYLRKKFCSEEAEAVGTAPAMAAPHLTTKTIAWSSEKNYPRGLIAFPVRCSARSAPCSSPSPVALLPPGGSPGPLAFCDGTELSRETSTYGRWG